MARYKPPEWEKVELDGPTAMAMRHDTRKFRREKGRAGRRFQFVRLKSLWTADGIHAVCNHLNEAEWLYFHRTALQGWLLMSWHGTRREAQAAAELPLPDLTPKPKPTTPGLHVKAGWTHKRGVTMDVACHSEYTAGVVADIFDKLGCTIVEKEMVDA
jgi:hypothetical protein